MEQRSNLENHSFISQEAIGLPTLTVEEWAKQQGISIVHDQKLVVEKYLTKAELKSLAVALKNDHSFNEFVYCPTFKNSTLDIEVVAEFAEVLRCNKTLQHFSFVEVNIGPNGAAVLADGLKNNQTLCNLVLASNNIGSKGAIAFANVLETNKHLCELYLTMNKIDNEGAFALAGAIKTNQRLRLLNLYGNNVGRDGTISLFKAVNVNTCITNILSVGLNTPFKLESNYDLNDKDNIQNEQEYYNIFNFIEALLSEVTKLRAAVELLDEDESKLEKVDRTAELIASRLQTALRETKRILRMGENSPSHSYVKATILIREIRQQLASSYAYFRRFDIFNSILFYNLYCNHFGTHPEDLVLESNYENAIERNQKYYTIHQHVESLLSEVKELLLTIKEQYSDEYEQKITQIDSKLNTALEEANKLFSMDADIPSYVYAEALLHQVYCQLAISYARFGNFIELINLYQNHFILHPDDDVVVELVDQLMAQPEVIWKTVGLDPQIDKPSLILLLLAGNKKPIAEIHRAKALYVLKGGPPGVVTLETFTRIADVGDDAMIFTFAKMVELHDQFYPIRLLVKTKELLECSKKLITKSKELLDQAEKTLGDIPSCQEDKTTSKKPKEISKIDLKKIETRKNILKKIKDNKVYIYEQLILEHGNPLPVTINDKNQTNIAKFESYALRAKKVTAELLNEIRISSKLSLKCPQEDIALNNTISVVIDKSVADEFILNQPGEEVEVKYSHAEMEIKEIPGVVNKMELVKNEEIGKPDTEILAPADILLAWIDEIGNLPTIRGFWHFFYQRKEKNKNFALPIGISQIPWLEQVREILIILNHYVEILDEIGAEEQNNFKTAVFKMLIELDNIFGCLNSIRDIASEAKFSEVIKSFASLNEVTQNIEKMFEAMGKNSALISTLPLEKVKAESYKKAIQTAQENISNFKTAQYSLYLFTMLAVITPIAIGLLVTLPYVAIPLAIAFLTLAASEVTRQQKIYAEEKKQTNVEALNNMPKTFSDYLSTDFKPAILPTIAKPYTFFGEKNLGLISEQSPLIQSSVEEFLNSKLK